MSDMDKSGRPLGRGIATAMLCLAAIAEAAGERSPLPALKPLAADVDITGLPSGEPAALRAI